MSIQTVVTLEGVVIREIAPSGECAYRMGNDGKWNYSQSHKNFWLGVASSEVPKRFKDAFLKFSEKYQQD
jgi:hypothetical protein